MSRLVPGAAHILSDDGMRFLPPFVRARLQYLAEMLDWYPGEEDEETLFTYHEIRGKLSDGYYTWSSGKYLSPIHMWIASDDNCHRSLYIGGASWICPDSHSLFFDRIDPALLPEKPENDVWWCLQYEEGIKVVKIRVCPSEEITEGFPDGV